MYGDNVTVEYYPSTFLQKDFVLKADYLITDRAFIRLTFNQIHTDSKYVFHKYMLLNIKDSEDEYLNGVHRIMYVDNSLLHTILYLIPKKSKPLLSRVGAFGTCNIETRNHSEYKGNIQYSTEYTKIGGSTYIGYTLDGKLVRGISHNDDYGYMDFTKDRADKYIIKGATYDNNGNILNLCGCFGYRGAAISILDKDWKIKGKESEQKWN